MNNSIDQFIKTLKAHNYESGNEEYGVIDPLTFWDHDGQGRPCISANSIRGWVQCDELMQQFDSNYSIED
jgi:hypothetical protein